MAYRASDYERWQQLDFVVGIHVSRTKSNPFQCQICSRLIGDYPKGFKFLGWHPQCLCSATPILISNAEFIRMQRQVLAGETPIGGSVNTISSTPANFKDWLRENEERMKDWKSLPYFVRDNGGNV